MLTNEPSIKKPLFIIGVPRSGTTLVADLISHHEDLAWFSNHFANHPRLPQLSFLNRLTDIPGIGPYLRGKERRGRKGRFRAELPYPREAYSVWDTYARAAFSNDYLLSTQPTQDEKDAIHQVIRSVLKYHGKTRFFNKMTGPARIGYLSGLFPDARFVHIIRDPRAVVSSLLKVRFWRKNGGFESPWWQNGLNASYLEAWQNSGHDPAVLAALQWRQIIEHSRSEVKQCNDKPIAYVEVTYEAFIEDPETVIGQILKFAELPSSRKIGTVLNKRTKVKNMNYKFMTHLAPEAVRSIETSTVPLLAQLGYNYAPTS